ncbi:MAG: excisionase family DNA-binding protein [Verrucomicrobiota bacterium]
MQEHWLSVEESAAHMGVSRDTIYKWLVPKNMPAHEVGSLWKFRPSGVVTVRTHIRRPNCEILQLSPSGSLPILNDTQPIA